MRVFPVVAMSVLLMVGAAAASPAERTNVDFFSAPVGPASAFSGVSHRYTVGPRIVIAARARRIEVIHWNGARPLLVAPTTSGGFCQSLAGPYGGTTCFAGNGRPTNRLSPGLTGDGSGPVLLDGSFFDVRGERLEIGYEGGRVDEVPIVWVGAPIDAGFFAFRIPRANRRDGHRPLTLSLLSGDGAQLAQTKLGNP